MPVLLWTSESGEKWKVLFNKDFEGDLLFTRILEDGKYDEAFSYCPYILKIVKDDYLRPHALRRRTLRLAARDIDGKSLVVQVPFELLVALVAKGHVFPKLLRWLFSLEPEILIACLPLATAYLHPDKFPKTRIEQVLKDMNKIALRLKRGKERKEGKDDPNEERETTEAMDS